MLTVAIVASKGGTGKSTVSVALAGTAAKAGETVVLLDADEQGNSLGWKNRREDETPLVVAASPGRLLQAIDAAREAGADLVLIDTPGKNATVSIEAASLADLVLIPTRPLPFDMETLPAALTLVQRAKSPPAFVLWNAVPPQGHQLIDQLKAMTQPAYKLPPCPIHLTQRTLHSHIQGQGKTLDEIQPDSPAVAEFQDLYLFIKKTATTKREVQHGKK